MSYTPPNPNGQAAMASSAPVVVASDQTAVPVGNVATIGTSVVPGTGATHLGKAEDAAAVDGDTGVMVLSVRRDSAASSAGTTGDYATLNTDNTGRLWANVGAISSTSFVPGTAATNLGKAEDATHVSGDTGVFALAVRQDTATQLAGTDGDYSPMLTDASGRLHVNNGTSPNATSLNTYATRITTNTTTTPTSSTAYISSVTITTEVGGTTSTVTIRDKQGTPQVLVNGLTTTAASLSPTVINFQTPVKMTSGIDIVTAGAVAGTVDVWINYYQ